MQIIKISKIIVSLSGNDTDIITPSVCPKYRNYCIG